MKITFKAPLFTKLWLVDWAAFLPYWRRSWQYDALKDEALENVLFSNWFTKDGCFLTGSFDFFPDGSIFFSNGTHRSRVLAKHMQHIPMGTNADTYRRTSLSQIFIRRIEKGEQWDIPDIPVRCGEEGRVKDIERRDALVL